MLANTCLHGNRTIVLLVLLYFPAIVLADLEPVSVDLYNVDDCSQQQ